MSEILSHSKQVLGKHLTKKTTRVDLTPMVDLGFLLITFFVFTTSMSTAKVMPMLTPKESTTTEDEICESCVITILLGANNTLYYFEGKGNNKIYKTTSYNAEGLRALLINKKNSAKDLNREAVLIIKPGAASTFRNLINIIDESNICMYKRYYLDKITAEEENKIRLEFTKPSII